MSTSTPHGLQELLDSHIAGGPVPGAVALVARGDRVEVAAAGPATLAGAAPMRRDSAFRIASITKPVVAAAAMTLVEDGLIAPADPVAAWLPELSSPLVVRTPQSPVDDVVPAVRPITLLDLLTFRAGYGFPSDFSLPAVAPLFAELKQGPPQPQAVPGPDAWMAALSRIPLLHQPGDGWLYNTCSDILGVLIARVTDRPLPEYLAERLFEPLGMTDTGFSVAPGALDRFTGYYRAGRAAAGSWSTPRTGSGAARPTSRPAPAAWSRPSTTGTPSAGCCSPKAWRTTDGGYWPASRSGR